MKSFPLSTRGYWPEILHSGRGCIYNQRAFRDVDLDSQTGIYSDAADGPCDVCMLQEETWKDRVIVEIVVCESKFHVDFDN